MSARTRLAGLAASLAATALAVSAALAGTIVTVNQAGRAFAAKQVEIRAGDTLRFQNADSFIHHVAIKSPEMNFDSPEQEPGEAIDVAFPRRGSFLVRCEIHPKMSLQVDVR